MIWKVPTRFCPRCRPTPCWRTRLSMPTSASSSLCLRQEKSSSFRPRAIERFTASTTRKCTRRATSWRTSIVSSSSTERLRPAMTRPPETSSPASIWPPQSFGSIEDRPSSGTRGRTDLVATGAAQREGFDGPPDRPGPHHVVMWRLDRGHAAAR